MQEVVSISIQGYCGRPGTCAKRGTFVKGKKWEAFLSILYLTICAVNIYRAFGTVRYVTNP